MDIIVKGDELQFDGFVLGILAQSGVPATIKDAFLSTLESSSQEEVIEELLEKCGCKHLKECPLHRAENGAARSQLEEEDRDALIVLLTEQATNGLLRLTDVCKIINQYMDGEI